MIYNGYEIDPNYVIADSKVLDWKMAGMGEYIVGRKNGVRWFLKKNNEFCFPTEKEQPDRELREHMLKPAMKYRNEREELKRLMVTEGGITLEEDCIVAEESHFIADGKLVTASRFVENVADDVNFTTMSASEFIDFCSDMAKLLERIHKCGVIHCDIKVGHPEDVMSGNIIAVRIGGKLRPYLIDFDLSFPGPPTPNPGSIPHSDGFESPEIVPYVDGDEDKFTQITSATDIFSLAVAIHRLWTGYFPATEEEKCSVGRCVANGKSVIINKKFDVKIGDNCGATLMSLINWMFEKNPALRPTASQVIEVLKDKACVPEEYHKGSDEKLFTKLWDSHKRIAEKLDDERLVAMGVKSFKRVNDGTLKYIVRLDKGEEWLTIEQVIERGYAEKILAAVEDAWEEHNIDMASPEEITAKGYAEISRVSIGGIRKYRLVMHSGLSFTHGYEWLISEGLASRKVLPPIEGDEPWAGDGVYADGEFLTRRGVVRILRVKYGAENRYKVEFIDREPLENVNANTMRKLRFIK